MLIETRQYRYETYLGLIYYFYISQNDNQVNVYKCIFMAEVFYFLCFILTIMVRFYTLACTSYVFHSRCSRSQILTLVGSTFVLLG